MFDYIKELWNTDFMPHGHCYFWDPTIMWTHAISDSIIALAYFIIPVSLVKIVRKRNDFTYLWMLVLFAIFIFGCGATHIMDVVNIWEPFYRLDSFLRVITALASIGTAAMLIHITPKLILFPSAKKWKEMNEELRALNEQLEQKVVERTIRYQEIAEKWELLTDTIPQIVWTTDDLGDINYMNKNWYDYTGLAKESEDRFNWAKVIHPEDLPKVEERWTKSVERSELFEVENRMKSADSETYRWHLTRAIPMKNKTGRVTMWLGTTTDIHDQKLQQDELLRINEELDNFVYVASHDLKTPINNLDGLMKIIDHRLSEVSKNETAPVRSMMAKSIEQLKITVGDLADISNLQRQSVSEDLQNNSIKELIEEFRINHHILIVETGGKIEMDLQVPHLLFSRKFLRSIIDNLLSNSLKYRAPGRFLRIFVQTYETKDHYVLLVRDNGLGIKPEYHERIFEMFRRFHRHAEGSGVGLNIVKRIVDKHKGFITVESAPEEGATFRIFLPKRMLIQTNKHS